jgi:hypothetical protein
MKKKLVVAVVLLLICLVAVTSFFVFNQNGHKQFYVGVTYCGGSVQEAKELVDKVKDYTNLFVLQSGHLQGYTSAMEEIGDYVVASKMNYAIGSSTSESLGLSTQQLSSWLIEAKERWGKQFIGIYYDDEPGGKMLDGVGLTLKRDAQINKTTAMSIEKYGRSISVRTTNNVEYNNINNNSLEDTGLQVRVLSDTSTSTTAVTYGDNGEISLVTVGADSRGHYTEYINYYSNRTITIQEFTDAGYKFYAPEDITKYTGSLLSYEVLVEQNPIQTYGDAADVFVDMQRGLLEGIDKTQLNKQDLLVFTADYGLYWWNYKGGYDVVLAELAWNHSAAQHIGLVRGAANLLGKSWGTILTWKYTQTPYLAEGEEMFEQMKLSYEAGAEYVIIFNYSEDPTNPNTLQEEHFQALEHFWTEVVQNPEIIHGGITPEAVLVLPNNYGWGMRNPDDNIWGLWSPDDTCQQIWNQMQTKLNQYGAKLDIVYDDPNYPIANHYPTIHYWNE